MLFSLEPSAAFDAAVYFFLLETFFCWLLSLRRPALPHSGHFLQPLRSLCLCPCFTQLCCLPFQPFISSTSATSASVQFFENTYFCLIAFVHTIPSPRNNCCPSDELIPLIYISLIVYVLLLHFLILQNSGVSLCKMLSWLHHSTYYSCN